MDVQDLEIRIKNWLDADAWLGDSDNITKIEAGFREDIDPVDGYRYGYSPKELPALCVASRTRFDSVARVQHIGKGTYNHMVPMIVFCVWQELKAAYARIKMDTIVGHVVSSLLAQSKQPNAWADGIVRASSIQSSIALVESGSGGYIVAGHVMFEMEKLD